MSANRVAIGMLAALTAAVAAANAGDGPPAGDGAVDLSTLSAWKGPAEGWAEVGAVRLDADRPRRLAADPGNGIITNAGAVLARNLVSKEEFGDVELHVEFLIPKGSNSGVKFQAVYEVQIFDSHGARSLKGTDSGAIYPRSELLPLYHQIDDGYPPLVNAARPAGEWQALDLTFRAPRFDAKGAKVADARIGARLNGQVVQDDRAVGTPTGSNWHNKEKPTGPVLLQADHGPVAFRNIKARRLDGPTGPPPPSTRP